MNMKMKVDYINNVNGFAGKQVEKLIKTIDKTDIIDSMVNNDIDKQEQNFKNRLEAKRRKIALSNSDITDQVELIKNKRMEEGGIKNNKSFIDENKNELSQLDDHPDHDASSNNLQDNEMNINVGNNILNDFDTSFEHIENNCELKIKLDEIDEKFSPSSNINPHSPDNSKKFKKQRQVFGDIKSCLDTFLKEFNFYFYESIFERVVDEIEKLLEEKHTKTLEISKNYNNQIKEMEFLLTSGKIILFILRS